MNLPSFLLCLFFFSAAFPPPHTPIVPFLCEPLLKPSFPAIPVVSKNSCVGDRDYGEWRLVKPLGTRKKLFSIGSSLR